MSNISEAEYLAAKKIVTEYETERSRIRNQRIAAAMPDLEDFFSKNKACAGQDTIQKFGLSTLVAGPNEILYIHPEEPYYDEDYCEDSEEFTEKLKAVGAKHGFSDCTFYPTVMPK